MSARGRDGCSLRLRRCRLAGPGPGARNRPPGPCRPAEQPLRRRRSDGVASRSHRAAHGMRRERLDGKRPRCWRRGAAVDPEDRPPATATAQSQEVDARSAADWGAVSISASGVMVSVSASGVMVSISASGVVVSMSVNGLMGSDRTEPASTFVRRCTSTRRSNSLFRPAPGACWPLSTQCKPTAEPLSGQRQLQHGETPLCSRLATTGMHQLCRQSHRRSRSCPQLAVPPTSTVQASIARTAG